MNSKLQQSDYTTVIEAGKRAKLLNPQELLDYRDLFRFLIWRQVKVLYAQSAIGIGWALIQPIFSMILFSIVFGKLARVSSDGIPYSLFSLAGLVPWTYFSNAVVDGVNSLVGEANMLRKVYFPRLLLPLSAVVAKLVDFAIGLSCLFLLMICYGHSPTLQLFLLPLPLLLMVSAASAISIWLTALAVQYRDVKHAIAFMIQLAMYASPVVYPTSLIPAEYRLFYAINPMVGAIEGFRAALLGATPMPWGEMGVGLISTLVLLFFGLNVFSQKERKFADVA